MFTVLISPPSTLIKNEKWMQSVWQTDSCQITSRGRASSPAFNKIPEAAAPGVGELPMRMHLQHWGIRLGPALQQTAVLLSIYPYINIKSRC